MSNRLGDSVRLQIVNKEILERQVYLKSQELIISQAVEEGNFQLKSLHYQILDLQDIKHLLQSEIQILNTEKEMVVDEIMRLQEFAQHPPSML